MKRFVFSLQAILELREREEEDAKRALGEKEAELQKRKGEMNDIRLELRAFQDEQKSARKNSGQGIEALRMSVSWRHKIKMDLLNKAQQIDDVMRDIDRARAVLIEATKKKKGLELLKDKKLEEWKKMRDRKDQAFLDELSINAHIRKQGDS